MNVYSMMHSPSRSRRVAFAVVALLAALVLLLARALQPAPTLGAGPASQRFVAADLSKESLHPDSARRGSDHGTRAAMRFSTAPGQAGPGIHGVVTFRTQAAGSIDLVLRRYRPGTAGETSMMTTTSGVDGAYLFTNVPTLPSGSRYYVRYANVASDDAFLAAWFGPDIRLFTAGQSISGGDFDIADLVLKSPPAGSSRTLPAAFTWQKRAYPADRYRLRLLAEDRTLLWLSEDLGSVDNFQLEQLPAGVEYNTPYWWTADVVGDDGSLGLAYYIRRITFLPATATPSGPTPTSTALPLQEKAYLPAAHR